MVPEYLSALFPGTVGDSVHYNLRNAGRIQTIPRRTTLFENSFIPSAIELWNNLPPALKNIQSIGSFKRELLSSLFSPATVPKYYLHGRRLLV